MLSLIFPIIYSAQYRSKRVVWYTYILTALGILSCTIFGYYFGLCDANMIFFTYTKTDHFVKNYWEYNFAAEPNWFKYILFFVLPKTLVVLGAVPMVTHLNDVIDKRTKELISTQEKNLDLSKEILINQQKVIVSLASVIESRDQTTGAHLNLP